MDPDPDRYILICWIRIRIKEYGFETLVRTNLSVLVDILPLAREVQSHAANIGLISAAAAVVLLAAGGIAGPAPSRRIVHVQVHLVAALADFLALAQVVYVGDALSRLT